MVLPRTRRRSMHAIPDLSRAPSASLRDRLRRPWTEPVCRQVRQQSGSGEGSGQDPRGPLSGRRPDVGDEDQGITVPSASPRPGATLGATRTNDLPVLRTHVNSGGQQRTRGHGLI